MKKLALTPAAGKGMREAVLRMDRTSRALRAALSALHEPEVGTGW
jgi:hypothetical protein